VQLHKSRISLRT